MVTLRSLFKDSTLKFFVISKNKTNYNIHTEKCSVLSNELINEQL